MAAFSSRDHAAFTAHWHKIMANPACAIRTVLFNGSIAGNMCAWTDGSERCVGYWIGREFWGRGIASAALAQFLHCETTRPLTARVVKHNAASIRVLQKAGFTPAGEVPPLPAKLSPGDPPIAISVFLEATTLGTTDAVVLVSAAAIVDLDGDGFDSDQGGGTDDGKHAAGQG